jgi:16S rRNA G527 N7-methylase RsmG
MPLRELLAPFTRWLPPLNEQQLSAIDAHLQLLQVWNPKINLTAIRDESEAVRRHVAESLFLAAQLPEGTVTICDLGSGGGFPGIPVGIARPDCRVTLVESDIRKGVFLREASRALPNMKVVTSRFETFSPRDDGFDWLISRAVNMDQIKQGPVCRNAALLTREGSGPSRGFFHKWKWKSIAAPWSGEACVLLGTPVNIG